MELQSQKKQSVIKVTYERNGIQKEISKTVDYPITRIEFPCDIAEMFTKIAQESGNPPKNITLYLNDDCIWHALDFETANIV